MGFTPFLHTKDIISNLYPKRKALKIFRKFKKGVAFCRLVYYYKFTKINWTITEEDSIFI